MDSMSDLHKPIGKRPRRRVRPFLEVLRLFAILTILLVFAMNLISLIAGTWVTKGDNRRLGMVNLSVVSFDGIVPQPNATNTFQVKMHWFLSAFGWEYPNAANKDLTAGLVYTGAGRTLRLPEHLREAAQKLGLSAREYNCFKSNATACPNPFFGKFQRASGHQTMSLVTLVFYISDMMAFLLVLGYEFCITVRPHWLKCRCFCLSSVCPCPKGSREEIENLHPAFWDKFRLWWYLFACSGVICSAVFSTIYAGLLVRFLNNRSVPNARFGAAFMAMTWGSAAAVTLGSLAIYMRKQSNERAMKNEFAQPQQPGEMQAAYASNPAMVPPPYMTDDGRNSPYGPQKL